MLVLAGTAAELAAHCCKTAPRRCFSKGAWQELGAQRMKLLLPAFETFNIVAARSCECNRTNVEHHILVASIYRVFLVFMLVVTLSSMTRTEKLSRHRPETSSVELQITRTRIQGTTETSHIFSPATNTPKPKSPVTLNPQSYIEVR